MKKLIVLPGGSPRNKAWADTCAEHFASWFDDVHVQYYDHWESGNYELDENVELPKLKKAVDEEVETYVFAKSIGSILTLLAVKEGVIKPEKCVFFGMPLELVAGSFFKDDWSALSDFPVLAIAFHNDNDPISYDFTKQTLLDHAPAHLKFITKVGDNHNYTEFRDYEAEIQEFLAL